MNKKRKCGRSLCRRFYVSSLGLPEKERERERGRKGDRKQTDRQRQREIVCVCGGWGEC